MRIAVLWGRFHSPMTGRDVSDHRTAWGFVDIGTDDDNCRVLGAAVGSGRRAEEVGEADWWMAGRRRAVAASAKLVGLERHKAAVKPGYGCWWHARPCRHGTAGWQGSKTGG